MEKLLSIVIPVYGVEPYIRQCLESLLVPDEWLSLLDVVIVNDGTKDQSAVIAREFESSHPGSFRVIDQENRGHGGALNRGTELAEGKYLYYLDSDDWFDTGELSRLLDELLKLDVDMVLLNRTRYMMKEDQKTIVELKNMVPGQVYDADTFDWLHCGNGADVTYAHHSVYRTEMMKRYLPLFCEKVMYDDIFLQVMPIMAARTFAYLPLNVYHYRSGRPGQSMDPEVRKERAGDVTTVVKHLLGFIQEYRDEIPAGSERRAWADAYYSEFCSYHYRELSRFPYAASRSRMQDWDAFVREKCPDTDGGWEAGLYRSLPFPLFYGGLRVRAFFDRGWRFLKRKICLA